MLWQFILAISLAIVAFSMPSMNRRSLLLAKNGTENNTTNQIKVPRISNNEWESRLQTILFEDNKNDVHPDTCENGTSCPVTVIFDAQLIRILKVNEREQFIQVYLWVNQYWQNPMLRWNPKEYGGVEYIYVSPTKVWVPDIVLYNSVDGNGQLNGGLEVYKHKVKIDSTGQHSWLNPVVFKSLCSIDVSFFPFDDQQCTLKFGSWSFDASGIDMRPYPNSADPNTYYIQNGEWELLSLVADRNEQFYQCCKEPFVDVSIVVKLRRQAINYSLTLIVPCALLSSLVFLNFVLPPESGERIGLSITVLLSITVFQQLTNQIMPPYDFPYLAQYYLATILETGFSLVATTLVLNFYHRSNRKVPWLLKKVVLDCLAPILFCGKPMKKEEYDLNLNNESSNNENSEPENMSEIRVEWQRSQNGEWPRSQNTSPLASSHNTPMNRRKFLKVGLPKRKKRKTGLALQMETSLIENTAFGLLATDTANKVKDAYKERRKKELELKQRERHWLKVARVLDRLFLVIFIILATATLLVIFFRAPRFSS